MKLLNKLIPVASLASIAAIVTPLSTSCAQTGNSITYNFKFERKSPGSEPTTPLNAYLTCFTPAEQLFDDGIDKDTAWQLYFDKLETDPSVFADDFLYGASDYWKNNIYDIHLLYEGHLKIILNSFDKENKRFSWAVEYSINHKYMARKDEEVNHKIMEKIIFNNFPIDLDVDEDNYWKLSPETNLDILSEDKDFSVDLILDGTVDGEKISSSSTINWENCKNEFRYYYIDSEWSMTSTNLNWIIQYTSFGFYYRPLHYLMNNLSKK